MGDPSNRQEAGVVFELRGAITIIFIVMTICVVFGIVVGRALERCDLHWDRAGASARPAGTTVRP